MRTATPFATCSVTSERDELATSSRDFDTAVHRAGVHHECVGLQPRRPLRSEAPATRVLADRREERLADPFLLDAQEIDDVDLTEDVVEVVRRGDGPAVEAFGQQRRRPDERQLATERVERLHVAAGDAASS